MTLPRTDYVSPPWWPDYPPHRKQQIALWGYERTPDLVYGGAAGGGKTDYLLMAASQFCEEPDYAALIIRKTFQDLSLPGAIMDRAIEWWAGKHGIQWNKQQHRFTWPSGAIVQFGYLQSATDHLRYQGAELQFVGVDEATQIPSNQLTYLHSRLRRRADSEVPMRYRLATNPGGVSHDFVRENYVRGADGRSKVYLPALLHENPGLDQADYRKQLAELDPITRRQLEAGDWDVQLSGGFFEVEKINVGPLPTESKRRRVRAWDLASTPEQPGTDPDYTVGALMSRVGGDYFVEHIVRVRVGPAEVERLMAETAARDGIDVAVVSEREPGSSGVLHARHLAANVMTGFNFRSKIQTGSKYDRAKPFAAAISNGLVHWGEQEEHRLDCFAELRAFNDDPKTYAHDDVVDTLSMAYNELSRPARRRMTVAIA